MILSYFNKTNYYVVTLLKVLTFHFVCTYRGVGRPFSCSENADGLEMSDKHLGQTFKRLPIYKYII